MMEQNDPYDPDMTVAEALAAGLIAIIDTGKVYGDDYVPCGYDSPFRSNTSSPSDPGRIRCSRGAGHPGVHAYVVRWRMSADDMVAQRKNREAETRKSIQKFEQVGQSLNEALSLQQRQEVERELLVSARVTDEMIKEETRALNKIDSQAYSPMDGHRKNARFRDQGAGKVKRK